MSGFTLTHNIRDNKNKVALLLFSFCDWIIKVSWSLLAVISKTIAYCFLPIKTNLRWLHLTSYLMILHLLYSAEFSLGPSLFFNIKSRLTKKTVHFINSKKICIIQFDSLKIDLYEPFY